MTNNDTVRINPTTWNVGFGYDQAQLRPAPQQVLNLAGQGPVDGDGNLLAPGDPAGQIAAAMSNVEDLLERGGMTLADVHRITVYTTDLAGIFGAYGALVERLKTVNATPPATLIGVGALAVPGMLVEIDVVAGR